MSDSTGSDEPASTPDQPGAGAEKPGRTASGVAPTSPAEMAAAKQPPMPRTPEQLERRRTIIRFAVFVVAGAVVTVLLYLLLSALIPRWWSQLVGRQVSGRISNGILLGLIYGFVFSFLPLIVLAQARHRAFTWPAKGIIVLIAAVLTAPNLMTLGIAFGASSAARAGDRVMDVNAPGFRYASLWGVVLGALAAVVAVTVSILWDRRSRELKLLRVRVEQLEKELPPALPVRGQPNEAPKPPTQA